MVFAKCPECGESVRLPVAELPADASAECPWCGESISAQAWMDTLPPVIKVVGADGQPIDFGPPTPNVSNNQFGDGGGSGGNAAAESWEERLRNTAPTTGGSADPAGQPMSGFPAVAPTQPNTVEDNVSTSEVIEETSPGAETDQKPFAFSEAGLGIMGGATAAAGFAAGSTLNREPSQATTETLPEPNELQGNDSDTVDLVPETSPTNDPAAIETTVDEGPVEVADAGELDDTGELDVESFLSSDTPPTGPEMASEPLNNVGLDSQSWETPSDVSGPSDSDTIDLEDMPAADETTPQLETTIEIDPDATIVEEPSPLMMNPGEQTVQDAIEETVDEEDLGSLEFLDAETPTSEIPTSEIAPGETVGDAPVESAGLDEQVVSSDDSGQPVSELSDSDLDTVDEIPLTADSQDDADQSSDKQKVPFADDQRSYYQRHTKSKKKSPVKQLIAYALGGALALPIAGGILLVMGKAPNLGFWPFDGSFSGNAQQASNRRAYQPPPSPEPSTDYDSQPGNPPTGKTLVPAESDIARAGQSAMGQASQDDDANEYSSASDIGSAKKDDSGNSDTPSPLTPPLDDTLTDGPPNAAESVTIDLDSLIDGALGGDSDQPAADDPSVGIEPTPDSQSSGIEFPKTPPPVSPTPTPTTPLANNDPGKNEPANNEPAGAPAEKPAKKGSLSDMLLVFPDTPPDAPNAPGNPGGEVGSGSPSADLPDPFGATNETPEPAVAANDDSDMDVIVQPSLTEEPVATVEAAKPALEIAEAKPKMVDTPPTEPEPPAPATDQIGLDRPNVAAPAAPTKSDPPSAQQPTSSDPPAVAKICDSALEAMQNLDQIRTGSGVDQKTLALSFVRISRVGELVGTTSSPGMRSVVQKLATLPELDRFGELGAGWLRYPKRQTDGIVLVGQPGRNLSGQTITLGNGAVVQVILPGGRTLPNAETVVAIGLIKTVDGKQVVDLAAATTKR